MASGLLIEALRASYRDACAWADRMLGVAVAPRASLDGGDPSDPLPPPALAA